MKKRKMRFNPDKAFRNFVILANIITIGFVIYKIATNGIGFLSTIRIFWIERRKRYDKFNKNGTNAIISIYKNIY